jgi:hypothetical protein
MARGLTGIRKTENIKGGRSGAGEGLFYECHSLFMLKRIAAALNKRVEIRFVSSKRLRTA